MTFGNARDQLLGTLVLVEAPLDLENGGACTSLIGFVNHYNVGQVEHDDLLQLQARAVIRIHDQHGLIDKSIFLKWHRFLASADRFDNHVIEAGLD